MGGKPSVTLYYIIPHMYECTHNYINGWVYYAYAQLWCCAVYYVFRVCYEVGADVWYMYIVDVDVCVCVL